MPNTYIKSEQYVALGLAALEQFSLLPNVFTMISSDAFANAENDTLYWKSERVTTAREYEWRTRTAPIILDKVGQTRTSITLDTHLYQGVPITAEELTLDLKRFATEIVEPQAKALAQKAEQKVVLGLRAADFKTALPAFYLDDDPWEVIVGIRRVLNSQGTPAGNRYLLCGAAVEDWFLKSNRVAPLAQGITSPAVRNASIGQMANMVIVPSPMLDDTEVFAVHPTALVIAQGAPGLPLGAVQKSRASYRGWQMLHTIDYDQRFQQDASVLSTFMGVNDVHDELLTEVDANGFKVLDLDVNGNPQYTNKNVRGAKGTPG